MRKIALMGILAGLVPALLGEEHPGWKEYRSIVAGMRALDVTVTLDRERYLQGEDICATVTVVNPTNQQIRALVPFGTNEYRLRMFKRSPEANPPEGFEWEAQDHGDVPVEYVNGDPMAFRKTVVFLPQESLRESVCLGDAYTVSSAIVHGGVLGVLPPGRYKLSYQYPHSKEAEFVVEGVLGESAVVTARLPAYEPSPESTARSGVRAECVGVMAAALRTAAGTVVVTSPPGRNFCGRKPSGMGLLRELCPFTRVGESEGDIASLEVGPADGETFRVRWADGRGSVGERVLAPRPGRSPAARRGRQNGGAGLNAPDTAR